MIDLSFVVRDGRGPRVDQAFLLSGHAPLVPSGENFKFQGVEPGGGGTGTASAACAHVKFITASSITACFPACRKRVLQI